MKIKLTYNGHYFLALSPQIPASTLRTSSPIGDCIKSLTVSLQAECGEEGVDLDFERLKEEEKAWLNDNCILTEGEKKYLMMDCKIYEIKGLHTKDCIASSIRVSGEINAVELGNIYIKIEYDPAKEEGYNVDITKQVDVLHGQLDSLPSKPKPTL